MRDKNLQFIQFNKQVEGFITKNLILPRMLRTAVVDNPTFLSTLNFRLPRNFKETEGLIIVLYYLPETLRWRLWLDLKERSFSNFNEKQKLEIKLMLSSKEEALSFLYLTQRYSSHEIFGNVIKTGLNTLRNLQVSRISTVVKTVQRKRGYDDKGSLRPKEKWLPNFDISFTDCQNEKEKKLDHLHKKIDRIKKYLRLFIIQEENDQR